MRLLFTILVFSTIAFTQTITPGFNFDGIAYSNYASAPPDANLAVGATQVAQWVNAKYAVYSKSTGTLLYGPVPGNNGWSGGTLCATTDQGDGILQYDKAAGRWIVMRHAYNVSTGQYFECVSVSQSGDATGAYYRYIFHLPNFDDYPKLSVWPDAYYLSVNLLNANSGYKAIGAYVCALDRNAMLAGTAASSQCFQLAANYQTLLPSDWDGTLAPPVGSPNFLVSLGTNALNLWRFHVDWQVPANSTLTGPTSIPVQPFTEACNGGICVPQGGTKQQVDSLGDRLMYRLAYRTFNDGHESLVVTHSVGTPASIRWYEIREPNGTPTIYQQGTYSPDGEYRWMGSMSMDKLGDIAVGYSVSGSTVYPSIRYAGRLASDTLGTLEPEISMFVGAASETKNNRWGDYTAMAIDPVDDCTLWYTNEYFQSKNANWRTRIASFRFSGCQ
jgi:hypothetical protein